MSSNSLVSIAVIAAVSIAAGVVGQFPDREEEVVVGTSGVGNGGVTELEIEDPDAPAGGASDSEGTTREVVGGDDGSAGSEGRFVETGGEVAGPGGGDGGPGGGGGGGEATTGPGEVECAPGRNGGETDVGVSANRIGLASTIVTSGPGSTFLGQSQFGMQAVRVKVNASGGVCGRELDLTLVNDNWEAQRGHGILRNFMNDDSIFALPVVPSSEGLDAAAREIEQTGIPVIGSDGMLISQYQNDWIWPVATATVSQMRIAVDYARDQDAESFAIVYDTRYRFGVEGRDAYENYVEKLPGAEFVHAEGVEPNQPGYGTQIDSLDSACGDDRCDAVLYLLDPGTANTWIQGDSNFARRSDFRLGAQPLFTDRFGQDCGGRCDGMVVFTGYVPPLEENAGLPGIQEYVQDVRAVQPNADVANQFLQGAYLGMSVFVEALEQTGPNLTRERLRQVMNSMTYESDLAGDLSWSPERRKANRQAQAWTIRAGGGSFDGFSYTRSGFLQDPDPDAE